MTYQNLNIRPATQNDAEDLVRLIIIAGDGLPLDLWESLREAGETVFDVGVRRAMRETGGFSYTNALIADIDGMPVAAAIAYRLPDHVESFDPASMPNHLVPLQELENLVAGTWYINVLATYETFRGRGIGQSLLKHIDTLAKKAGCSQASIITSDLNPALRLYQREGFIELERRKVLKPTYTRSDNEWIVLAKSL